MNFSLQLSSRRRLSVFAFGVIAQLTPSQNSLAAPAKMAAFVQDSGTESAARKAFLEGATLAAEKFPSSVLSIESHPAAEGATPESASLKALVEGEHVPLVVYWSSDEIAATAPFLNQSKTLGIVASEVGENIPRLGSYIFGFGYSIKGTFFNYAKFAGNKLKAYRFGLISTNDSRFDSQAKAFSEQTKSLGNTVVFDEKVEAEGAAWAPLVARLNKEKCDSVFAAIPSSALSPFLKAVREAKYKGKIFLGDSLRPEDLAPLGKDAEGVYLIQTWSDDDVLLRAYAAKFGKSPDPVTLGAVATGYDLVNCVAATPAPVDADSIKYSFLSSPCEGLTGKTGFTGERIAQRKKRILSIQSGQFVLADK